jgi:tRNA pseudouridine synthase 9
LQYLGHPIANDPIYSNQRVFGPDLAMGDATGCDDEDIIARLSRMGKDQAADAMAYHEEMMVEYNKQKAEKLSGELCVVCKTPLYTDPGEHELVLYLHARKYASADGKWSYETELPAWALPPPDTLDVGGRTDEASEEDTLALADKFESLAIETGSNVIIDGKEVSLKPEHQASVMPG